MKLARTIYRIRRRRALLAIRATAATLGRDPGDLLRPRNYRRFLRGLHRVARASVTAGVSMQTFAVAMQTFAVAMQEIIPPIRPSSPR